MNIANYKTYIITSEGIIYKTVSMNCKFSKALIKWQELIMMTSKKMSQTQH
jgi:hypothetical protein